MGPTQGENPELLTRLASAIHAVGVPFLIIGDWNCNPEELSSVLFPDRVGGMEWTYEQADDEKDVSSEQNL